MSFVEEYLNQRDRRRQDRRSRNRSAFDAPQAVAPSAASLAAGGGEPVDVAPQSLRRLGVPSRYADEPYSAEVAQEAQDSFDRFAAEQGTNQTLGEMVLEGIEGDNFRLPALLAAPVRAAGDAVEVAALEPFAAFNEDARVRRDDRRQAISDSLEGMGRAIGGIRLGESRSLEERAADQAREEEIYQRELRRDQRFYNELRPELGITQEDEIIIAPQRSALRNVAGRAGAFLDDMVGWEARRLGMDEPSRQYAIADTLAEQAAAAGDAEAEAFYRRQAEDAGGVLGLSQAGGALEFSGIGLLTDAARGARVAGRSALRAATPGIEDADMPRFLQRPVEPFDAGPMTERARSLRNSSLLTAGGAGMLGYGGAEAVEDIQLPDGFSGEELAAGTGTAIAGVAGAAGLRRLRVGQNALRGTPEAVQAVAGGRQLPAIRDSETDMVFVGSNHMDVIIEAELMAERGEITPDVVARLALEYERDMNGPNIGFARGDTFMDREAAMSALGDRAIAGLDETPAPATPEPRRLGEPAPRVRKGQAPHPATEQILELGPTMSAPEIAAQIGGGLSADVVRRILARNGITPPQAARAGRTGSRQELAARNARILQILNEVQPTITNKGGKQPRENSFAAIAAQMQREGYTDVTSSVVAGVVKRNRDLNAPQAAADATAEAQRISERTGIPLERVLAISARRRDGNPTGAIAALGLGAGAAASFDDAEAADGAEAEGGIPAWALPLGILGAGAAAYGLGRLAGSARRPTSAISDAVLNEVPSVTQVADEVIEPPAPRETPSMRANARAGRPEDARIPRRLGDLEQFGDAPRGRFRTGEESYPRPTAQRVFEGEVAMEDFEAMARRAGGATGVEELANQVGVDVVRRPNGKVDAGRTMLNIVRAASPNDAGVYSPRAGALAALLRERGLWATPDITDGIDPAITMPRAGMPRRLGEPFQNSGFADAAGDGGSGPGGNARLMQSRRSVLEAAEQLAERNGGVLPPRYSQIIAQSDAALGYSDRAIRLMLLQIREGEFGPELALRAQNIEFPSAGFGGRTQSVLENEAIAPTPARDPGTPTPRAVKSAETILTEMERLARQNGGELPSSYAQTLADGQGYSVRAIRLISQQMSDGRFGEDLARRANALRSTVRRPVSGAAAMGRQTVASRTGARIVARSRPSGGVAAAEERAVLAALAGGEQRSTAEIARESALSEPEATAILARLENEGVVQSSRGRGGQKWSRTSAALLAGAGGASLAFSDEAEASDGMEEGGGSNLGAMALGAAGLIGAGAGLRKLGGIRAFHGSPHDFDRFSMAHIGRGEGAQAYGHGLYFAEAEDVARGYRDSLAGRTDYAQREARRGMRFDDAWVHAARGMLGQGMAPAEVENTLRAAYRGITDEQVAMAMHEANPGRMYEVRINAEPEEFLDWDAPLSGQSESVRRAWDRMIAAPVGRRANESVHGAISRGEGQFADPSGESFYKTLYEGFYRPGRSGGDAGVFPEASLATSYLRREGIPGIRYLDGNSRSAGDGSRNYVLFRDDIIEILRKYGLPLGIGTGAGLAAFSGSEAEASDGSLPEGSSLGDAALPLGMLGAGALAAVAARGRLGQIGRQAGEAASPTQVYRPNQYTEVFVEPDGRVVMNYQGATESGGGSGAEALSAMRGAMRALEEDIATNQRPVYYFEPNDARLAEFYRAALSARAPEGYVFSESPDGVMSLVRADVAQEGVPQAPAPRLGAPRPVTLRDMRMGLLDAAPNRIESDIDPRLILGGGAALVPPVGALTAIGLEEWKPWEEQFSRENAWLRDAERRTRELQDQAQRWGY